MQMLSPLTHFVLWEFMFARGEPGRADLVPYWPPHWPRLPWDSEADVAVEAFHLLGDSHFTIQSLHAFGSAYVPEPRQGTPRSKFIWCNLGVRTDLHRGPRPGDKGLTRLSIKPCTDFVIFSQYTEDSCHRNPRWAHVARVITARQISRAELQLLHVLEWDLSITEDDVLGQTSCIHG
jgi:hypothetical protein